MRLHFLLKDVAVRYLPSLKHYVSHGSGVFCPEIQNVALSARVTVFILQAVPKLRTSNLWTDSYLERDCHKVVVLKI